MWSFPNSGLLVVVKIMTGSRARHCVTAVYEIHAKIVLVSLYFLSLIFKLKCMKSE